MSEQAKSVLVVEDDDSTRYVMTLLLEMSGYHVVSAANGQEALGYLREHGPPDVILLDLMMPVMDGWQFRRQQQHEPALAGIPVVLVSADSELEAKARQLSVPVYLRKPIDIGELMDAVGRYA